MFISNVDDDDFCDVDIIVRLQKKRDRDGTFSVHAYLKDNSWESIILLSDASEDEARDLIHRVGELKDRKGAGSDRVIYYPAKS